MTPLPPITSPTCLRVSWAQVDAASKQASSRIYVSFSSAAPSAGALTTLAGVVATAWGAHIKSLVQANESLASVTILDMSSDMGAEGSVTDSISGTNGGDPLPSSACAVINHTQARRYRGGRPRTYLRCGATSDLDGTNKWTTDFQSSVLTGWEAFVAEILADTTSGITLGDDVLVSYYDGIQTPVPPKYKKIPVKRDSPLVSPITGSEVAIKIGSQRRRLAV